MEVLNYFAKFRVFSLELPFFVFCPMGSLIVMHSELSISLGSVDAICAWIGIDLAKYSLGRPFPVPMPSKAAIPDTS